MRCITGIGGTGMEKAVLTIPDVRGSILGKTVVTIPSHGEKELKRWGKVVNRVATEFANGYAFQGPFITLGHPYSLRLGSLVIIYGEVGNHEPLVLVVKVVEGNFKVVLEASGKAWAMGLRDAVAVLLSEDGRDPLLVEREELLRRVAEIDAALKERSEGYPTRSR